VVTLWDGIKRELATMLAPAVYQSRVAQTYQALSDEAAIVVRCPDSATSRWLERQLGRMIAEIAASMVDTPLPIRFTAE
jgi:hypothetical protein